MKRISYDFNGTTTVITGGTSGIGLATAELIARSGGSVIVSASRSPEKTQLALERIINASENIPTSEKFAPVALPYDAGNETSVAAFFAEVARTTKRVDYIIHSAAISPDEDYEKQNQTLWDTV